jgi:hypothetical protein
LVALAGIQLTPLDLMNWQLFWLALSGTLSAQPGFF